MWVGICICVYVYICTFAVLKRSSIYVFERNQLSFLLFLSILNFLIDCNVHLYSQTSLNDEHRIRNVLIDLRSLY